jgi:hypothetical protein
MRIHKRHHISKNEGFMKIHNDFTLYWRVFPSGKRVVYYYAYDKNGKRLMGRSTGETNMTAARVKCNQLLKEGSLIPDNSYKPTFADYAQGWWERTESPRRPAPTSRSGANGQASHKPTPTTTKRI